MSETVGDDEGDYDVVLLVEQTLTGADARQVHELHSGLDVPVRYHVVMPVEDAAARVEAAMGSVGTGEMMMAPSMMMDERDMAQMQHNLLAEARRDLESTTTCLQRAGADVAGEITFEDPIEALRAKVAAVDGREAIILTRPHVVSEFFHLDWTSRARRAIGVPVLHLLEHESTQEQGAGPPEGVTGV